MHSGKGLNSKRPWGFHPLEFAISGDPGSGKTTLISRLASVFGEEVGVVDARGCLDPDPEVLNWLSRPSLLIESPPVGMLIPRLHLLNSSPKPIAGRQAPPVAVAGSGRKPRRLNWGVPWFSRDDVEGIAGFIRGYWDSQLAGRPLLGLVLTGGLGALMGQDKALLTYAGKTQVERTLDLLAGFCSQTWLSCRPDQAASPGRKGWPQIHDRFSGRGPLGGILSALEHRPEAPWLVVACDHPYLDEATLSQLLAERDPRGFATAFRGNDGHPQPLCTVYEPKSRLGLLQTWALGYSCPRKLLTGPGVVLVDARHPEALADVNTPREDELARSRLGR